MTLIYLYYSEEVPEPKKSSSEDLPVCVYNVYILYYYSKEVPEPSDCDQSLPTT